MPSARAGAGDATSATSPQRRRRSTARTVRQDVGSDLRKARALRTRPGICHVPRDPHARGDAARRVSGCFGTSSRWPRMKYPSSVSPEREPEIRVVYVEDDDRLARLTTQYLNTHGVEVHVVPRGDQATAAVLRVRPDVVLLDLMLPGGDGLDV